MPSDKTSKTPYEQNWRKVFFEHNSLHIQIRHFSPLFNACYQIQFQKNLMKRFSEKLKSVDFGPHNETFALFWI